MTATVHPIALTARKGRAAAAAAEDAPAVSRSAHSASTIAVNDVVQHTRRVVRQAACGNFARHQDLLFEQGLIFFEAGLKLMAEGGKK